MFSRNVLLSIISNSFEYLNKHYKYIDFFNRNKKLFYSKQDYTLVSKKKELPLFLKTQRDKLFVEVLMFILP